MQNDDDARIRTLRRMIMGGVAAIWVITVTFFVGAGKDYEADVRLLQRSFKNWLPIGGLDDPGNYYTQFHPQKVVDSYGYSFQYFVHLVGRLFSFIFQTDFAVTSESRVIVQNIIVAAVGFLGCVIVGRALRILTDSSKVELAAFGLLAVCPLWVGHSWMNQKDIPFATGFVACTLLAISAIDHRRGDRPPGWFRLSPREEGFYAAVAVILTFGTRPGVALLTLPLLGATLVDGRKLRMPPRPQLIGLVVGSAFTLITNPASLPNPVAWLVSAVTTSRDFPGWSGQIFFFGRFLDATKAGPGYLFTEYFFQTPMLVVLGVAGGAVVFATDRSRRTRVMLPLIYHAAIVPVVAFTLSDLNYNAGRQYLFVIPGWVLVAAIGLHGLLERFTGLRRSLFRAVLVVLCIGLLFDHINLYPFQYVYRNEAFRLIPNYDNRFEFDYWGLAGRQAADDLAGAGPGAVFGGNATLTLNGEVRGRYPDGLTIEPFLHRGQIVTGAEDAPFVGAVWLNYWPPAYDELFDRKFPRCIEHSRLTTLLWPSRIRLGTTYWCP